MSTHANPRPKRRGEEFSRNHYTATDNASKKPRFDTRNPSALAADAPEEDEVLDADEIGKRGQGTKRNAVNIDGYASDSSNEGFDGRAELKARKSNKEAGSKDEEENDMFADLEDEEFADKDNNNEETGSKKKKSVKFLDVEDIQGQVQNSRSGGHVRADFALTKDGRGDIDEDAESSTDSEIGDEIRASIGEDMDEELGAGAKKKHAPKLDAFNLKAEKEEGEFDEHGNFVRKAHDPDAIYDTWMDGLSKKDMKKAREAHAQREKEQRQKRLEDDSKTTREILETLIPQLESGETILEALARLGKGKEKKKPKWQNKNKNRRNQEMNIDVEAQPEHPAETKRKEDVEAITGAADLLFSRGNAEIYDAERESLIRMYKRETGEDWHDRDVEDPDELRQWVYRWSDARDGGDTHGPYDSATMKAWNNAGYFGEGVEFRNAEDESAAWKNFVDF
jgi:CD2 antigen cytoplasmic tail-binding protein 2